MYDFHGKERRQLGSWPERIAVSFQSGGGTLSLSWSFHQGPEHLRSWLGQLAANCGARAERERERENRYWHKRPTFAKEDRPVTAETGLGLKPTPTPGSSLRLETVLRIDSTKDLRRACVCVYWRPEQIPTVSEAALNRARTNTPQPRRKRRTAPPLAALRHVRHDRDSTPHGCNGATYISRYCAARRAGAVSGGKSLCRRSCGDRQVMTGPTA